MKTDQSNPLNSPFNPQAQSGRSKLKVAVFSVLAVHVAGLTALLLTQGCKREAPPEVEAQPEPPLLGSNDLYYTESNPPTQLPPPDLGTLPPPTTDPSLPPGTGTLPPSIPTQPPAGISGEYVVKSGDSFYSIAKANNTTIKAIEAANPGVDSRRLKIGQKLVLPAPDSGTTAAPVATSSENVYVVKSGDTLSRIATLNKTTVKELKSLNGLTTDRINVGQKLKLPAPPAPAPAPVTAPLPEPTYSAPPTTVPTTGQ